MNSRDCDQPIGGPARPREVRQPSPILASWKWLVPSLYLATIGVAFAQVPRGKSSVERMKADVYYLASNTLEGRGVATRGIDLAAEHIRAEFKRIGLKSGTPDGSFFQPFEYAASPQASRVALRNVVGVLEGKGEVANETIVIGAHFDHLGLGRSDSPTSVRSSDLIYPGADDNASGVAAILELARRFASRATPPRRRMVFIAFGAEEAGLVGSGHYVSKDPLFPIRDTVTMVNFDMVGRLRENVLGIAGDQSAGEFADVLAEADDKSPLRLMLGGADYPEDSDHAPFANVGVPILYVCTGSHEDRHTPSDTAVKVNFDGMEEVVGLCETVLDRLQAGRRPAFKSRQRPRPTGAK
jgi:hypothetical protein